MEHSFKNILVVEANPAERINTMVMLNRIETDIHAIYEAEHGIEAIDKLTRFPIDLIITGIDMPVMNGKEMINILHNHSKYRNIPVIVITALSDEHLRNMVTFLGHGYIQKPLNRDALEAKISNLYGENNEYYLFG
ncbi:MAG: hypothetical protein CL670_08320 [Balneola sp.]|jgi:YesN/AraC family two-component response regulator|nr:hypothetical protein [Balneola sp.]MBE79142.1 hypothetical protein [Balneola sp.]HBX66013.1 hypothetical protein [Balneolaceae bacterium]|tara:strand:+ start:119 stop:526 length:408 start_codon:yes stop_codon:yes gene_type:complete